MFVCLWPIQIFLLQANFWPVILTACNFLLVATIAKTIAHIDRIIYQCLDSVISL